MQDVLHLALILQCSVLAEIQSFSVLEANQDSFNSLCDVTDSKIGD